MTVKTLVDFDVISYRKHLIGLKNMANQQYLDHKGTIEGASWASMKNAFQLALDSMEKYASFEREEEIKNEKV